MIIDNFLYVGAKEEKKSFFSKFLYLQFRTQINELRVFYIHLFTLPTLYTYNNKVLYNFTETDGEHKNIISTIHILFMK